MLRADAIGGAALVAIATLPSLLGPAAPPSPPPDVGLAALPSAPAPAPAGSAVPGPSATARVPRDGAARQAGADPATRLRAGAGDRPDGWAELVRAAESGRLGPRPVSRGAGGGSRRRRGDRRRRDPGAAQTAAPAAAAPPPSYSPSYAPSPPGPSSSGPGEFRFEH